LKIGRNDICWCGSGKKFKHCHLGRDTKPKVELYNAEKLLRKSSSKQYCCCPESFKSECSRKIVRAHTVPKSSSLKKIAKNGHLYHLQPDLDLTIKNQGIMEPTNIGVNRASTFTGFCGHHDKQIFSPLEDKNFTNSLEQCFLLFYRAICFSYYQKRAFKWMLEEMRIMDQSKSPMQQLSIQTYINDSMQGVNASLRDMEKEKHELDDMLVNKTFKDVKYYIITFDKPLDVMCSGNVYPEYDFNGNRLIDLSDISTQNTSYSISSFANGDEGVLAFVWLGVKDDLILKFVKSLDLYSNEQIPHYVLIYLFEFVGNLIINPAWWDSLYNKDRKSLCHRISSGAAMDNPRDSNCLTDDGLRANNWNIINRTTNAC